MCSQAFQEPVPLHWELPECFWVSVPPWVPRMARARGAGAFPPPGSVRPWLNIFSWGQTLWRRTEFPGMFQNWEIFLPYVFWKPDRASGETNSQKRESAYDWTHLVWTEPPAWYQLRSRFPIPALYPMEVSAHGFLLLWELGILWICLMVSPIWGTGWPHFS